MRIFLKKAVKSPQRRGIRPRTPIGFGGWELYPQTPSPALFLIQRISTHLIPPALIFVST